MPFELFDAASDGDYEKVKQLLKLKSIKLQLNKRNEEHGDTPLVIASYKGHYEVVELLTGIRNVKVRYI